MTYPFDAPPKRIGATRAGEEDTRGLDFSNVLPAGASIATITSITVTRRDGVSVGSNDLTILTQPWITNNAYGNPIQINWWHTSDPSIAGTDLVPTPVDYKGTVVALTSLGHPIIRDFYILVVPGLG